MMKGRVLLISFFLLPVFVSGQNYNAELKEWRQAYIQSLQRGNHPLKTEDIENLRYYEPDADYCVHAKFTMVKAAARQVLKTEYGGGTHLVKEYGYADFELMGTALRLHIYKLVKKDGGDYDYFIPFSDPTNGTETYRGGRYLNISDADFQGNKVTIDFNKSYNPRAAYVRDYPYIIPPKANHLRLDINAGEKAFGTDPGY